MQSRAKQGKQIISLGLLLTGALLGAPAHAAQPIAGWGGEKADLMYSTGAPPVAIGSVQADGTVDLALPESVQPTQSLSLIFGCNGAETVTLENPEASYEMTPAALLVADFEQRKRYGYAVAASSEASANAKLYPGEKPIVEGSWYQWMYLDGPASVQGHCSSEFLAEGDTPSTIVSTYEMDLQPGWNLVETQVTRVLTTSDGRTYNGDTTYRVRDSLPDDALWVFVAD